MKARLNPFRSDRVERYRYRLDADGWAAVRTRLADAGYRGLILGPHGTGKTVFLEDLREQLQRLEGRPTRLYTLQDGLSRDDRRRLPALCRALRPGEVFFLDGTEWLSWGLRRRLRQAMPRRAGWVCTGHRPFPGLPVLWETRPDPAVARHLLETLLERPMKPAEYDVFERRFRESGGNVREVLRALYHEAATCHT